MSIGALTTPGSMERTLETALASNLAKHAITHKQAFHRISEVVSAFHVSLHDEDYRIETIPENVSGSQGRRGEEAPHANSKPHSRPFLRNPSRAQLRQRASHPVRGRS